VKGLFQYQKYYLSRANVQEKAFQNIKHLVTLLFFKIFFISPIYMLRKCLYWLLSLNIILSLNICLEKN